MQSALARRPGRLLLTISCLLTLGCAVGAGWCQGGRFGRWRIDVTPAPRRTYADGKAASTVRVEVRDATGSHAPDGMIVVAHTDLGLLSLGETDKRPSMSVDTRGGFATLYVSSEQPGTAQVRVQVEDSYNVAYVDFVPPGEPLGGAPRVVKITGGWVGFSQDYNLIEAKDCAVVTYGSLRIEAEDSIQLDLSALTIKAKPARFVRGGAELSGCDAYYELQSNKGAMRCFADTGIERVFFDGLGLTAREEGWEIPETAFSLDTRQSDNWYVCRSASVFVGEKVVLDGAALYVQGTRVLKLPPYWIIGLPGYTGSSNSQTLGISSSGGLVVQFPWYYRVTDRATGAVTIQKGARAGTVIARDDWSLGLQEEYRTESGQGRLAIVGLPHADWGVSLEDQRTLFGDALSNVSIGWPDHRSLFVDASLFGTVGRGRVNVGARYIAPRDASSAYRLNMDWLADPRQLLSSGAASYRFGASVGLRNDYRDDGTVFTNELYAAVDLRPLRLGPRTALYAGVSNLYSWDTGDFAANSTRGQLRLTRDFSDSLWGSLDYSAEYASGDAARTGLRQVVGLSVRAYSGTKWYGYFNASHDLTESGTFASLFGDYYPSRAWRVGMIATYYNFDALSYSDVQLELGRKLLNREIALRYSIRESRLSLELAGLVSAGF